MIVSVWTSKKQLVPQDTFENNRAIKLATNRAEQLDVKKERPIQIRVIVKTPRAVPQKSSSRGFTQLGRMGLHQLF